MKKIAGLIALLLLGALATPAATITAASCAAADVQNALNLAKAGDTVVIPAGSANWTQGVSWSAPANVTIKGAGTSATGGGDQTTIVDNIASGAKLLDIQMASTGVFRMTGITFQSGTGAIKDGGTVNFGGPGNLRVDHCRLVATSTANYKMMNFGTGVFGVMHHCLIDLTGTDALYFSNGRTEAGDWMGNYEWSLPTEFGSSNYFYIEDNIINGNVGSGTYSTRIFDGFTGAKVVVRFNTVSQAVLGETHATGHSPDDRGLRSQEIYCNKVTSSLARDPNYAAIDLASGTAVVWGNSWDQVYKNIYLFKVTRRNNGTYGQTATPNGWGYAGTEFVGTGSMWDGGTALGTDPTKGYPCLDQPGRGQGDLIRGGVPSKKNNVTGTIYWPHQALEPIYLWNNSGSIVSGWGGNTYSDDSGGRVVSDRDYYKPASGIQTSPTSPFNGTTGCGWGTLANRPTTCTPGVAYFATDQGAWNTSASNPYGVQQNGADGVLYKCTAPNTWTAYYTPYTYPHPLQTGGATNPPSPPAILTSPTNLDRSVGAAATFTVSAGGSDPLNYQWQKGGTNIAGAVTATYAILSVALLDAGDYRCRVTNAAGVATSAAAVLTVTNTAPVTPTILTSPTSLDRSVGSSATFSVSAGGGAPFSYQWQKGGTNISGALAATYTISSVALSDAGNYRCRVSNAVGVATSAVAVLTVTTNPPPAPNSLPEGDNGIAARFPGDAGIGSDSAVLFADDFESVTSSSGLTTKWTQTFSASNIRIATESGNFFGGSKAVEFTVPQQSAEGSAAVVKQLSPEQDVLFLRYYSKFDAGYNVVGSSHNGSSISAKYCCPGEPANGVNKFLVNFETARFDTEFANPGKLGVYTYHPDQRDQWGDFFFPTGVVSPFTGVPFNFGTNFVSRPDVIPQLGRWYCYEVMVRANTPGQRDGRIALWLDGRIIADFQNLRLRETTSLKIDKFDLDLYVKSNTLGVARKWYDNVVAATAYIGPMKSTQPPAAPTGLHRVED